jgi:large subunit ribosomal protein L24
MQKFKKNDQVIIISGNDRGKIGKITKVLGEKLVVEGVNIATFHQKPTSQQPGKILKIEKAIHRSNVSHCENGKPVKIKFIVESKEGKPFSKKIRISKKTENKI